MKEESTEIFDEVNADLKHKELVAAWNENKYWIVGSIAAAIITTASMAGWREWDHSRNISITEELTKVVEAGMDDDALEKFAADTSANHSVIARFILASAYVSDKKWDEAIAAYDAIANTTGVAKVYKNFAKLMSIKYRFQTAKTGGDDLLNEIEPLTSERVNWRYEALQMKALILSAKGEYSKAVEVLNEITSDALAPANLREQASKLTNLYKASEK